jgi:hypothetical protein
MGVSGQHHAPAALYLREKDPRYPLYRRLGGPQSRSGHRSYKKNPFPPPGIEPRSPGRPACSQALYCLSYPGSLDIVVSLQSLTYYHCFHAVTRTSLFDQNGSGIYDTGGIMRQYVTCHRSHSSDVTVRNTGWHYLKRDEGLADW